MGCDWLRIIGFNKLDVTKKEAWAKSGEVKLDHYAD